MSDEDLEELRARHAATRDAARPDAVARRHAAGGRTARENVADLVDVIDPAETRSRIAATLAAPAAAAAPRRGFVDTW